MPIVEFLLKTIVNDLKFNQSDQEKPSFSIGGPHNALINFRQATDTSGWPQQLELYINGSLKVSKSQHKFVEGLFAKRFVSYPNMPIDLPYKFHDEVRIDESGNIASDYQPFRDYYPPKLRSMCDEASVILKGYAERFIRLMRWQQNFTAPHRPLETLGLYWRLSGDRFEPIGGKLGTHALPVSINAYWEEIDRDAFRPLWNDPDAAEPFAHELLREAVELAETSPRSALLSLASALEVGVKTFVGSVMPQTAWLLENGPSPPVLKIIKYLVPKAVSSNPLVSRWSQLGQVFKVIEDLVRDRNALTHRGDVKGVGRVREYINNVRDFLYIFDVLAGHEWAKYNVSSTTRKKLGWNLPQHDRPRAIIVITHELV